MFAWLARFTERLRDVLFPRNLAASAARPAQADSSRRSHAWYPFAF